MVSGRAAAGALADARCPTSRAGCGRRRWRGSSAPDDALLAAVLVKLFADRQIAVAPELIRYLRRADGPLVRRRRGGWSAALDRAGLARHRPITARLAAEVLHSGPGDAPVA